MSERPRKPVIETMETRGSDLDLDVPPVGLTVLHSPDAPLVDRRFLLEASLRLGRVGGEGLDVAVEDASMSRQHALLTRRRDGDIEIRDLESRNGTWLEGRRVTAARVAPGSILRLGDTLLELGVLSPAETAVGTGLVGTSAAFGEVLVHARRVAGSDLPVLLLGETGTGKEVLARQIHVWSRRTGPFLAVNCSAIPAELAESQLFGHRKGSFTGAVADTVGFFEAARAGTLFLDEVGELAPSDQPKLLRVLESGEFTPVGSTRPSRAEVRVIAATNRDLLADAAGGTFRRDLYARLGGYVIHLPPLRQRRSDIPRLLRHFAGQLLDDRSITWTADFLEPLLLYGWPLNARELRFLVERVGLLDRRVTTLTGRHLAAVFQPLPAGPGSAAGAVSAPAPVPARGAALAAPAQARPSRLSRPPRQELIDRLAASAGNVTRLAEHYGKNPKQVYRWLGYYGIRPGDFRSR